MQQLAHIIAVLNNRIWGVPLLILLVSVGIYLTVCTRAVQVRHFIYAHRLAFAKSKKNTKAKGDISHFQALMTALAATIGIGSITGVATAIAIGGLGALVWMWVAAFFGMATKYGEAILAIKYRITDTNGQMCGGPMYYIARGMRIKWLAGLFAVFGAITAIGTGNMVQSNSVALALKNLLHIDPLWTGTGLTVIVGISLIGGIKSIGKISGIIVPLMAVFYIASGLLIIFFKISDVPEAFLYIMRSAFQGQAAIGGFAGATIMTAIQFGISRGVFSGEAGLGSSPIAAAAAKTDTPGRQALVSMCSVFITTGLVCTITGLVIALSGVLGQSDIHGETLDGSAMALRAFDTMLPFGGIIVTVSLVPFAFSTILGWAYYGEKCLEYLLGCKIIYLYRFLYTVVVFPGSIAGLHVIWNFANMMNGLMAIPNLLALFVLSGTIAKETTFFDCLVKREKNRILS